MARTGRPLRLVSKIAAPTPDDPDRQLTVAELIYERMEQTGTRAELCAIACGCSRVGVQKWLRDGENACTKAAKGHLLTPNEVRLRDFVINTRMAHAKWIQSRLLLHAQIAAGGLVIGKVIEEVDPTDLDEHGKPKVLKRRMESSKALPSAESLRWELERLAKDVDGQRIFAPRVEVTGADGGPVEVESREDRAARLASELAAFQSGAEAQRALDGDCESNGSA